VNLTPQDLAREVASTGFGGDALEKALRLLALLDALGSHPFLKTRIALKGGTALNLFHFDLPRPSVDVDLNYVGASGRETMLEERAKVERVGLMVYGGINRKDWRAVSPADVKGDPEEAARELVPMLRPEVAPTRGGVAAWFEKLLAECRERLGVVLPLRDHEQAFLERLNGSGEIAPELLTSDGIMQRIIRDHPGLQWKALNVRRRRGVVSDGGGAAEDA
jgi:hypothetical protein